MLINTGSNRLQGTLVSLDGSVLGVGVIHVSRYIRKITGEDIFELVRGLLRIDEEVAANRRSMGGAMLGEGNGSPATAVRAVTSTPPSPASSDLDVTPRRSARAADEAALPPEKYARGKPRTRGSKGKGKGKGGGAQPTQTQTPPPTRSGGRGKGGGWSEPVAQGSAVPGRGKGGFNAWNYHPPVNSAPNPPVGIPTFVPPAPRTYAPGECFACKCAGREFKHSFRNCAFDAEMRKPAPPQPANASSSAPKPKPKPSPPTQG